MTRERYLEKMSCKIASYVYAVAVLKSWDANYFVDFDEIEQRIHLDKPLKEDIELVEMVKEELHKYGGLEGDDSCVWIDLKGGCFDINLWHDYRASYTDLDEEESMEEE